MQLDGYYIRTAGPSENRLLCDRMGIPVIIAYPNDPSGNLLLDALVVLATYATKWQRREDKRKRKMRVVGASVKLLWRLIVGRARTYK